MHIKQKKECLEIGLYHVLRQNEAQDFIEKCKFHHFKEKINNDPNTKCNNNNDDVFFVLKNINI